MTACPVCSNPDCHYWHLRREETWHPVPAPVHTQEGHLSPIYRLEPSRPQNSFAIGLDPREALVCLARGSATLDDVKYRVSLNGWDGMVQPDGRVSVRCDPA